MRRLVVAALLGAGLLAGCGGASAPTAAPTPTAPPASAPTAGPTSEPRLPQDLEQQAAMAALAREAERAAGQVAPRVVGPLEGGDVSWPQCPRGSGIPERRTLGLPMPLPSARFVVVGLTNGPAFFPNPCLADQVAWVRERGLLAGAYAVASFPDDRTRAAYAEEGPFGGDEHDDLRNVGYQQALFNLAQLREAGLPVPLVWVDVEPVRDWEWSADPGANAAVVEGIVRGYRDHGFAVGVYSTPALWEAVVGDLALGVPEWRAAGETSRAEALSRCGEDWSIGGGPGAMGQWLEADRDRNVTCPGAEDDVAGWFHDF
nr:hypothetical protein [Nocardioides perillae]